MVQRSISPTKPSWNAQRLLNQEVNRRCRELRLDLIDLAVLLDLSIVGLRALKAKRITSEHIEDCFRLCYGGGIPLANPAILFSTDLQDVREWIGANTTYIDELTRKVAERYAKYHREPHSPGWQIYAVVIGLFIEFALMSFWGQLGMWGYIAYASFFLLTSWTAKDVIAAYQFRRAKKKYQNTPLESL